ncbi:hypothetical protein QBC33DRAFT_542351 [Phialemonium atrogriseum]|uniref:Uncharacterized protein n=1 Tax=Phialemonium atrogriseum TaxID=1093897 RepID=A0AAJ0BZF7_9PEZI|nr:uncharacterized protein QBC33DRAFT_542351 [Phialemonium atrogriseum]KAK1766263.1 hypothetical protein QBC33DRAFT_542351 [Phialemonium atrogriseum]
MLSPINEGEPEDTTRAGTPRFVENSPFRNIRATLQTSPEFTSQHASPRSSFSSIREEGLLERCVPSSSFDGAGLEHCRYIDPGLMAPTPVFPRRSPICDIRDENVPPIAPQKVVAEDRPQETADLMEQAPNTDEDEGESAPTPATVLPVTCPTEEDAKPAPDAGTQASLEDDMPAGGVIPPTIPPSKTELHPTDIDKELGIGMSERPGQDS